MQDTNIDAHQPWDGEPEHNCEPMDVHVFKFTVEVGLDFNEVDEESNPCWGHKRTDVEDRNVLTLQQVIGMNRTNISDALIEAIVHEYGLPALPWLSVRIEGEICRLLSQAELAWDSDYVAPGHER